MTPTQFEAFLLANPLKYLLFLKTVDTPSVVSFSILKGFESDTEEQRIAVYVRDVDFHKFPGGEASGWERKETVFPMLVTDKMMIPVVGLDGVPRTETKINVVGYTPWPGPEPAPEEYQGEPIEEEYQAPRFVSEWFLWVHMVFLNARLPLRDAFAMGIMQRKKLSNQPLMYIEQ